MFQVTDRVQQVCLWGCDPRMGLRERRDQSDAQGDVDFNHNVGFRHSIPPELDKG